MSTDVLAFYSKSSDKPPPGSGAKEHVEDARAYALLARHKGWRRVLSNFHESEFTVGHKRYKTIEHAFQASKIGMVDPARAHEFALDSGSALSRAGAAAARRAGRTAVILTADQLDVWGACSEQVMENVQEAKFSQCDEARRVLLATGDAQLWHIVQRRPMPIRFWSLERVRQRLLDAACDSTA